jgi:glycosyltransferase involved in cell wall biosynthesis
MALPIGIHAVRDFARLNGLLSGDLRCLWMSPKLVFERKVGGRIWPLSVLRDRLSSSEVAFAEKNGFVGIDPMRIRGVALSKQYYLDRMRVWSYFVGDSNKDSLPCQYSKGKGVNALWVGRMLDWKRVNVLIKAFKKVLRVMPASQLHIVGEGPERKKLERLAGRHRNHEIIFSNYLKTEDVRKLMQTADVYVMPSDGGEGWGAAVLEALTEKCLVISTVEAGSSATMLPITNLYNFQKAKDLAEKICNLQFLPQNIGIDNWTGERAAESLMDLVAMMKVYQHESK